MSARSVRIDEYGGEAAREIGRFSLEPPGPQDRTTPIEGEYVIVWRKSGGQWQHDSDIWNFTKPPEPDVAAGAPGRRPDRDPCAVPVAGSRARRHAGA